MPPFGDGAAERVLVEGILNGRYNASKCTPGAQHEERPQEVHKTKLAAERNRRSDGTEAHDLVKQTEIPQPH